MLFEVKQPYGNRHGGCRGDFIKKTKSMKLLLTLHEQYRILTVSVAIAPRLSVATITMTILEMSTDFSSSAGTTQVKLLVVLSNEMSPSWEESTPLTS